MPGRLEGSLRYDHTLKPIGAFIPDPAKSQVDADMVGTKIFKNGAGGDVDISKWLALCVVCGAGGYYYYGDDATKTMPLEAGVKEIIWNTLTSYQITIVFAGADNHVQGM